MRKIIIRDSKNEILTFDLIDILNTIGDEISDSRWMVHNVEAVGESAANLHAIGDSDTFISNQELLSIASNLVQVIEGEFEAFLDSTRPWLIIRAVDSSEYDVDTNCQPVIEKLFQRFQKVEELSE